MQFPCYQCDPSKFAETSKINTTSSLATACDFHNNPRSRFCSDPLKASLISSSYKEYHNKSWQSRCQPGRIKIPLR